MKRSDLNRREALKEIRLANFRKLNVTNEISKLRRMKHQLQLVIASIDYALDNMARMGTTPLETAQIKAALASDETASTPIEDTASCPHSKKLELIPQP